MGLDTSRPTLQSVGDYDLVEKIAEGGMGTIYKGRHRQTGQTVAVKIVPPHMASNQVLLKRFEQEFRAASMLDHPNIVRALDYGHNGTTPYIVMEFVEGESLGQRIERDGKLPEIEAIRLIALAAQGLHKAHKMGLIHRDVKPDNIMVTPDGQAKLADLGLVKEAESDLNLTRTGRGLGTPHFMAPEQFRNAKNADIRCDIYSLGATLYMMVTGELPFKSCGPLDAWMKKVHNEIQPPRKLVPALSERVEWAILRAMSADPNLRPSTCREFVEDLTGHSTRKVPTGEGETAPPDVWYLVYKDEEGTTHTVKGSTAAIRRSLKEGLLGDASNLRASRDKRGPFDPLRNFPEYRDLCISLASGSLKPGPAAATATPLPGGTTAPVAPAAPPAPPAPPRSSTPAAAKAATPPPAPAPAKPAPLPTKQPPTVVSTGSLDVPQINLPTSPTRSYEWVKWLVLIVLAAGSAVLFSFIFF
jgi:serine/threonine protein kinase